MCGFESIIWFSCRPQHSWLLGVAALENTTAVITIAPWRRSFFANIFICLRDKTLMALLLRQINHVAAARKWRRLTQALQTKDNCKRFFESSFNYQQLRSPVHQIQLTASTSGYLKKWPLCYLQSILEVTLQLKNVWLEFCLYLIIPSAAFQVLSELWRAMDCNYNGNSAATLRISLYKHDLCKLSRQKKEQRTQTYLYRRKIVKRWDQEINSSF